MYLHNHAYMRSVQDKTPFETWYRKKPNVNNQCEFGAPIWILHQEQNRGHKFEPKFLQRIFKGFNDRNKAVKYFNLESQKILTSRCYCFLTLSDQPLLLNNGIKIEIAPDVLHEGESSGRNALQSDASGSNIQEWHSKRKCNDIIEPREL